ncbi:MAG TPA: dihydrofolate reductase family protein, partial [Candidatus Polarisedimenticolaceae bacterium]|nr:dihydrofolate reductase family protein [Candidatus Polarisedimenticolaceae bacterium]
VGAGTLRADDPPLHVRSKEMREYRRELGKPPELTRVVATRSLELGDAGGFFRDDGARRIVATVQSAPEQRLRSLSARAEIWRIGAEWIDLGALLERLCREGVERLLVEGGGELNWSLLRDDLIDEVFVTVAPALLGGREAPTPIEGVGLAMSDQRRLKLIEVERSGDELFTRWAVRR